MRRTLTGDLCRPAKWLLVGAALVLLPVKALYGLQTRVQSRPAPTDSFPHERHKKFACLTCHFSLGGHGRLTFQPPRGCQICHHQAPTQADCSACHQTGELAVPILVPMSVSVPREAARTRSVGFPHGKHAELDCIRCHTTPVTLEPADSVVTCHACHDNHHESGRSCATCHKTEAITAAHEPPRFKHMACDACHTPSRVPILVPTRSFCLVCHDQAQDHHAPKECTDCHFLRSPEEFRELLTRDGAP